VVDEGVVVVAAAALMAGAALAVGRPSTAQAAKIRVLPPVTSRPRIPLSGVNVRSLIRHAGCLIAALAAGMLVPFPLGVAAAIAVFYVARRVLGQMPAPPQISVPAPLLATCADLIAACLEAGAVPAAALTASGRCLPEPLGPLVSTAGQAVADGATIEEALPESGVLAPIAAIFRRSSRTGSTMTEQLVAVAEQLRADDQFDRMERAQRASVLAALPLGLCMLPAFLLLAVVPAIAGLGAGVLH
jgi:Flp pilus assembly protein TadB